MAKKNKPAEPTMKIVACNICRTKEATVSDEDAVNLAHEHARDFHGDIPLKHLLDRHILISIQEE